MSGAAARAATLGDRAWQSVEKVSSELFVLTYGAVVAQLVKDCPNIEAVNHQLDLMGYNIGVRLVDEFMAKRCDCIFKTPLFFLTLFS
jgi:hypothetical protein